jgi:membrane fusion protein, multidrug efflux system
MRVKCGLGGCLCVAASLAMTTVSCSKGEAQARTAPQEVARGAGGGGAVVPVTVGTVERRAMPLTVDAVGTAEAFTNVQVRAQITGALTQVNFTEGQDVAAGQTLFTLDRRPLEAALAQAQAALQRDTAQAANAAAIAARYADLQSRGIATREQAETSRTAVSALEATLAADRAAVENARVQLQYATIVSPISGRTGALMVHEGNLVRANDATPLVVINQVSPVYVSFGIPESRLTDLRRFLARGAIRVEATPSGDTAPAVGRVSFIDNAVDPATGQVRVKALFDNRDHRLWPGQFANVSLTLTTDANAIVVPTAAVQTGQQGTYAFVVKPDQTVDMRPVAVQRTADDLTIIQDGLAPGDVVVTDGQLRLVPGARISVKTGGAADADAKAAQ